MAARLEPARVQAAHQSLHHFVAKADWSDEAVLTSVRHHVVPAIEQLGATCACIVDDTGFPKKGTYSVGVARQYCGQLGKQDNCQVVVSLSVANEHASLPIAYRLYLPEAWAKDAVRRRKAGVPDDIAFQTKPAIALEQIRTAREAGVAPGVVLADAGPPQQKTQGRSSKHLAYPQVTDPADPPIRPERHVFNSIATVSVIVARALARNLARCPCCQQLSLTRLVTQ
jgi:SRSO17 transposase